MVVSCVHVTHVTLSYVDAIKIVCAHTCLLVCEHVCICVHVGMRVVRVIHLQPSENYEASPFSF